MYKTLWIAYSSLINPTTQGITMDDWMIDARDEAQDARYEEWYAE